MSAESFEARYVGSVPVRAATGNDVCQVGARETRKLRKKKKRKEKNNWTGTGLQG
jgi:hypothetical protein